jgi:hypothetical protein
MIANDEIRSGEFRSANPHPTASRKDSRHSSRVSVSPTIKLAAGFQWNLSGSTKISIKIHPHLA